MTQLDTSPHRLFTGQQAAHYLGVSLSTLRRIGIPSLRVGKRSRRFDPADLDHFILASKEGAR